MARSLLMQKVVQENMDTHGATGATGSSVDGLAAGTYSVVITDGAGCTSTQSIILNSNDNEKPDLKAENCRYSTWQ
jgi:hypothetical protein